MAKYMVIVESPAKSKTIHKILGNQYLIKASMGHIYNLPEKDLGIDIKNNFEPTYVIIPGREKVVRELKSLAKKVQKVYLATDLDREGEAIAAHLADALGIPDEKTYRVIFNEITPGAIKKAFENPGKISEPKVNAQKARRILDRLVGYKISPLLWKKITSRLSAGRVQSVALRLVVERELEIQNFKPEEYWEIDAKLLGREGEEPFLAKLKKLGGKKAKIKNEEEAVKLVESLEKEEFKITKVERKEKRISPPAPFITSTLQQRASTQLGFAPKKTMTIAQQLYEGIELGKEGSVGLITYMRTDSVNIAKDAQQECREYLKKELGSKYVPKKPPVYKSRSSAQEAHEAIRPTSVLRTPSSVKPFLSRDQYRLYKLIWERFVASQMTSAKYDTTTVEIQAGNAIFQVRGRILKFDGFLKVYGKEKEEDTLLPPLEEGQKLKLLELLPSQHFTKPPPRYTEASLVRALEKEGIGRPSTYAVILSNIQNRKYIRVEKKTIYATDLGILLVDRLKKHFPRIMDLKFTSHMEEELDKVEEEKADWLEILKSFYSTFMEELEKAEKEMKSLNEEPTPSGIPCEVCGKEMLYLWSRNRGGGISKFLGCSGYPECSHTVSLDEKGEVQEKTEEKSEYTCQKCGSPMIYRYGKKGKFLGCSKYPDCTFTQTIDSEGKPLEVPKGQEKCEKCGSPMAVKQGPRGPFLACTAFPKCRNAKPLAAANIPEVKMDCDLCGSPMAVKFSRRGPFLACTAYPDCKNTKPMSELQKQEG
ncbi:MAG: type I DNA topoisomerase [Planctomycetota bacterium]|nr:MAG: type I DNA topoisomerase [Planctomycetota bacterium]